MRVHVLQKCFQMRTDQACISLYDFVLISSPDSGNMECVGTLFYSQESNFSTIFEWVMLIFQYSQV